MGETIALKMAVPFFDNQAQTIVFKCKKIKLQLHN
jgi:hypothetical protein